MNIEVVHDIIEENGKTIKENNLEKQHNIKIGTLVEISNKVENMAGARLFVVKHTRDCDGTPLYSLSADKEDKDYNIYGIVINNHHGGFCEESLRIV